MGDTTSLVRARIEASLAVKRDLVTLAPEIAAIGEVLVQAYVAGAKALFFGNGGSAADAQHLAAELVGRYQKSGPALPALALGMNGSLVTAVANDFGYDEVFAREVEALGQRGDVAVAISTSGNSVSVLRGVEVAKRKGLVTVGLTGADGGKLAAAVDHCLRAPSRDTPRIQEAHILVGHIWCELIEARQR